MSPSTIYLVTGANRGIGFGLVRHALEKHDDSFVYAGARDPSNAITLQELKAEFLGRIEVLRIISGDEAGNKAAAKEIEERHGRVDTVIANAAIWNTFTTVSEVPAKDLEEHFHVNVTGPIVLFQSIFDLLKKSQKPRFIPITSIGGCIGMGLVPTQAGGICYGSTKAALNWAARKIHFENDWLVAFPLSPGGVHTDMVKDACNDDPEFKKLCEEADSLTTADASVLILKVIDESTREQNGGEFMHLDGTKIPSW